MSAMVLQPKNKNHSEAVAFGERTKDDCYDSDTSEGHLFWKVGAMGLLVLSVLVNAAMTARIADLESKREADTAWYREQIEQAERVRDLAVRELGAMALQQAEERKAREEQEAAYSGTASGGPDDKSPAQRGFAEAAGIYTYVGNCTITYYCCEAYEHICGTGDGITATGLPVSPGMVAVDPEVIPLGSTVVIDGQYYLAADTGVTGYCVDVAVPTHAEALELGVRSAEVWVVKP